MKNFFRGILQLRENTDFEKTTTIISDGISLKGYNLWLLLCSAMLASIGLDTNSSAVIIGAMLISPLMSPILGVGLAVGTYDRQLLIRSLRELLIAVVISLAASVFYFSFSPLAEPTTELQARTFPTLLDVLVALFGGIAGIVSISRHDQTNAIPGVAIATALMPPLCTAGFGIATANWNYFFGAFYLFFINAIFISLATFLIVRYLRFPQKKSTTASAKYYHSWFIMLSVLAFTPSIYFLYTVYKNERIKQDIQELVLNPITKQGNEILKWEILNKDSINQIKVYHSGKRLSDSLSNAIDSTLKMHNLRSYKLISMRVNITKEEVSQLSAETVKQMFQEMHLNELHEQSELMDKDADTIPYFQIAKEAGIAFTFLDTLKAGTLMSFSQENKTDTLPVFFFKSRHHSLSSNQKKQLYQYLLVRTGKDTLALLPL
jgi:uncharacterized hydrophobic protein (TIGR00271 family)